MDVISSLPQQLVRTIVSFATAGVSSEDDAAQLVPRSPQCVARCLPQLALLSRGWRQLVREMEEAHHAATHTLTLRSLLTDAQGNREAILNALYEELAAKSDSLLELKLVTEAKGPFDGFFLMQEALKMFQSLEDVQIDWPHVFSGCRKLLRLDLSAMPLNSIHIGRILDAASTQCVNLQALVLPATGLGVDDRYLDPADVISSLYIALERWHKLGSKRGLVQLTVPKRHIFSDSNFSLQQRSEQFLTAAAQFCPDIEYLDGWKATYVDEGDLRCDEIWFCGLETWASFCRSCVNLREFNWFVAPFDQDFLEIFSLFPKPKLKKMTLTCGNDDYFSDSLISGEYHRPGGFDFTGESVARVFSVSPALEELHVLFNKRLYRTMWLQDRINDDFLRCIAECCPELKKLTIDEVDMVGRETVIANITDQGLFAIARMPRLLYIKLKQTRCSAHGILALVQQNPSPRDKRHVVVNAGSVAPEHTAQFYDALTELMTVMLTPPMHALANHCFKLELIVHGVREVRYKEAVRRKLLDLREEMAVQHPGIEVFFCGQIRKTKKVPMQIENVRSVVFVSSLSQQSQLN
ncbi:hypothetical protein Gpo141_00002513 [Globisporangium polare]